MPLITPEEYLTFVGSSATVTPQLTMLCDAVSIAVENYIGRELSYRQRVEYYCGTNRDYINLRCRPVYSIDEVKYDDSGYFGVDDSFDSTSVLDPDSDYMLDLTEVGQPSKSGILYRINAQWLLPIRSREPFRLARDYVSLNIGNIKVTYTAGYDPIPADIKMACCQIITRMKNSYLKHGGPLEREHLGDWSYKIADLVVGAIPELGSQRQILSKYRELPW